MTDDRTGAPAPETVRGGPLLRPGRADQAAALSDLALRSKGHWGYDEAFLAACREELTLRPDTITARRTTVAERDGRVVGFATLQGDTPEGELGMLFVDPAAIGTGVGRLLYEHVLREAGRLGFSRLLIGADPYAEPFYLAMGARRVGSTPSGSVPGRELPLMEAWPRLPEPAWVGAWTGGRRAVHLGNVGEYNAQFTDGSPRANRAGDHYACLAAFCSPHPAILVLPRHVEESWTRGLARRLGWEDVEVHGGVIADGGLSEAVLARPALLRRVASAGLPVIPWGRTAAAERIVEAAAAGAAAAVERCATPGPAPDARPTQDSALRVARRYESKAAAHELFRRLAPDHEGIAVPEQLRAGTRGQLARALAARAATGATTVVKREFGVGGSGTSVVTPRGLREAGGARALARRLAEGETLIEEYVRGAGPYRDPTFDAVVAADGTVHPVGTGLMEIDGTSYSGVTVGPGVLPDTLGVTATRFGTAVGRVLAAEGYRGWYDVDFVTDTAGRLAPVEINLRLTGPAAAFMIQARLDRLRGGRHLVRTLDRLPLGARLSADAFGDHLDRLGDACDALGVTLLPTVPTAGFEPDPYVGVALAARTREALDAAETAVRGANAALGGMFEGPGVSPGPAAGARTGPRRLRRSSR